MSQVISRTADKRSMVLDRTAMNSAFETLCDILDDELVRQETILALLHSQREAFLQRDLTYMQAKSSAMEALIADAAAAEAERHRVLRILVDTLGLLPEEQTLSALITHAPERLAVRLRETQAKLQSVMSQAKGLAQANGQSFRYAAREVGGLLDSFDRQAPARGAYTAEGRNATGARQSLLLDQRG